MQTPLVFLTSRPELLAGSVTFVELVAVFTGALSGAIAAGWRSPMPPRRLGKVVGS